jgi:hypothetical protein
VGKLERQRGKKKPKGKLGERGAAACVKENGVGSCWKNEWGFVLLAGQGEENGRNGVERKTKNMGGLCCWLENGGGLAAWRR